jgi:NTE family protein
VTAIASLTSGPSDHSRRKTALVLAGGGITGFFYEVGVLAALDDLAGGATSNDFDVYVGTSAGAVLAALLANGARPREIFEAVIRDQSSSPFCFQSRDILGWDPADHCG